MGSAASARDVNGSVLDGSRDGSNVLDASVRLQLLAELDSALAFADYCRYIGQEQVSSCAEEMVSIAQKLYEETRSTIGHTPALGNQNTRTQLA